MNHTYAEELRFAVRQVERIGELIAAAHAPDAELKADGTPVTAVDMAGNRLIHEAVDQERPGETVLGEEDVQQTHRQTAGRVWVCDPVDGTWLLAAGIPLSVTSLALVEDGQPIVAAIRNPHTRQTFTATAGGGAFRDGRPLTVNPSALLRSGAAVTLPGCRAAAYDVAGVFSELLNAGVDVLTVGSVVHDATLVAAGLAAGMVFPWSSPWDMAAVALLTAEAGGKATALDGTTQRYDDRVRGAVLSNGLVHDDLVSLIARHA